jgi:uncharacterized protein (TIGR03086 family)
MKPSDQLRPGAEAITTLIAGMSPEQIDNTTPCDDWTVRELLNHVVGGAHMFAGAFTGQAPAGHDGHDGPVDLLGGDPAAAWQGAMEAFEAGVDSPGALDNMVPMPWGPTPGTIVYEILKFDVLVHAWDLAKATGQQVALPDEMVEGTIAVAKQFISPELRASGAFGPEVEAPAGASPIERLAAFSGRSI